MASEADDTRHAGHAYTIQDLERRAKRRRMVMAGHGKCLQAIELIEDTSERLRELRKYVVWKPDSRETRRAARLIAELESST